MKVRSIAYWSTTVLAALAFLAGGIADLARGPEMVANMAHLGYPAYFLTILGAWKVLGAIAVVAPRWPRLKEWAYAGMSFDLTGASLSHAASGDPAKYVLIPLALLAVVIASWALRPAERAFSTRGASLLPLRAAHEAGSSSTA